MPIRLSGLASGLDTESIISQLVSAYRTKEETYVKAQTTLSWKQDLWKSLNTQILSLYKTASSLSMTSAWTAQATTISNSNMATVKANGAATNGSQTLQIEQLAKASYITGGKLTDSSTSATATKATTLGNLGITSGTITVSTGNGTSTTNISVTSSMTISDLTNAISAVSGVNASYDTTNGRLFVSASNSGSANAVTLSDSTGSSATILNALKLAGSDAVAVTAQDAKINLNGAEYTSAKNEFVVNGLTIDCLAETGTSTLSITTSTDTQGIYDKVKDFLTQYNTLVNTMTAYYNADSAKGYAPLSSSEKSAMSDTEVEQWEAKIKSSLLRRDDTLSSVMNLMENSMSSSYYVLNGSAVSYDSKNKYYVYNGVELKDASNNTISDAASLKAWAATNGAKKYSFSSFGISTLGILNAAANQENAYHIDGDSDDTSTANNTDKLLATLTSDPTAVQGFMKQVTAGLYSSVGIMMGSTKLRSVYTVYNDKEMAQEYSDYTTTISDWEKKLNDMEDYYYSKFAAMESALSELQGKQSSLSSLLG